MSSDTSLAALPTIRLNNKADRRLRAGHLWVYSNEVNVAQTPLKSLTAGDQVLVENAQGRCMGVALLNPNSLICARLISRDPRYRLDKSLLVHRFQQAASLRERMNPQPFYRLVYGDSDALPGLVIDRYGDVLVVQIGSAAMERARAAIIEALLQVFKPSGILFRNDGKMREAEGLDSYTELAFGEVPERVQIEENGVKFAVPVHDGQKTGWFYDHRANRARLRDYVAGCRVLDVFSYVGGWGVQAAAFGAREVCCIDVSAQALAQVADNAALNGVADRVSTLEGSAFEQMKALLDAGESYDVVIMDPPAFIPKRKDAAKGEQAYRRANELAMRLLSRDGILVSGSCSMHLARERLVDILRLSARHLDRQIQILEQGGQSYDHPVHPAIPETDYLKAVFARVYR